MTREEQLACLNDRPCEVCKFHKESGCERWACAFEEEPEDAGEAIPVAWLEEIAKSENIAPPYRFYIGAIIGEWRGVKKG